MPASLRHPSLSSADRTIPHPAVVESLYIHIPFCHTRCGYCDFYKIIKFTPAMQAAYLQALLAEAVAVRDQLALTNPLKTIFLGGGTPSIYDGAALARLLNGLHNIFTVASDVEITIECNPGTLSPEKLAHMRQAGINRISLGVQSFAARSLKMLGRRHTVDQIFQALDNMRHAGFDNYSIDLIFATPGQTFAEWQADLQQAVALHPKHISTYNLTYHEGTPYWDLLQQGTIRQLDDELEADMYQYAIDYLQTNGFRHYEISNFTRPGYESRHNRAYWDYQNYIGLGASAHSCVDDRRWVNIADVDGYIRRLQQGELPPVETEHMSVQQQMGEMLFLGLRQRDGVSVRDFERRFNASPLTVFRETIDRYQQLGFLVCEEGRLKLTHRGLFMADSVFIDFMDAAV